MLNIPPVLYTTTIVFLGIKLKKGHRKWNPICDTKDVLNADFNTCPTHYTYINTSTHESACFCVCQSHKYFSIFPSKRRHPLLLPTFISKSWFAFPNLLGRILKWNVFCPPKMRQSSVKSTECRGNWATENGKSFESFDRESEPKESPQISEVNVL